MEICDFTYHRPASLDEASRLGIELGDAARYYAGGTELLVDFRSGRDGATHLISLKSLSELGEIRVDADGLHIGAMASLTDIAENQDVRANFPVLREGILTMAGAQILFQPSCSSDEIEAVCWKRSSGRAQQPVGPNTKIFHCVANTIGQSPDGKQNSSGASFMREPNGIPLAEAGFYQEEMITAVLDLARADRSYILDSMRNPPFLAPYWQQMVADAKARKDMKPQ